MHNMTLKHVIWDIPSLNPLGRPSMKAFPVYWCYCFVKGNRVHVVESLGYTLFVLTINACWHLIHHFLSHSLSILTDWWNAQFISTINLFESDHGQSPSRLMANTIFAFDDRGFRSYFQPQNG